jgi:hypothetical protein
VVARVERQTGEPPFSPTQAIRKFAGILHEYGLARVNGDHWGGNQTRSDWEAEGISYETHLVSASDLYERLEPRINAQTVSFVDVPRLRQQLLSVGLAKWEDPAARRPIIGRPPQRGGRRRVALPTAAEARGDDGYSTYRRRDRSDFARIGEYPLRRLLAHG